MLSIAATVILYNPPDDVIQNINSYVDQVEKLYVVDNSAELVDTLLEKISSWNKAEYISNKTNIGIAAALNVAAKKAIEDDFDYLLTMDQDSKASQNMVRQQLDLFKRYNNLGLVAANPIDPSLSSTEKIIQIDEEVLFTITSGNILDLSVYKKVGGFMEKLFIDHVDHEYCLRLNRNNYKVIKTNRAHIFHKIGNPTKKNIFRWVFYPLHHSPLRLYYRTRNRFYVSRIYRELFSEYARLDLKNFIREVLEIIIFEKNVLEKIKMIVLGFIHYKKNQFGKFPDAVS